MLTWIPVWNPPPKSTGSLSGSRWAQAVWMRSREVIRVQVHEFGFDLFEGLAPGLGQFGEKEEEASRADAGVDPERHGHAQQRLEDREGVSQQEASDPEEPHRNGHGRAPNPVGEDFGDQHPRHRRERHGISRDGRQHQHQEHHRRHVAASFLEVIAKPMPT